MYDSDKIRDVVEVLAIVTGTKFYMNWLLVTNGQSKNPIIRFIASGLSALKSVKIRKASAVRIFTIHIIGFLTYIIIPLSIIGHIPPMWWLFNLFVNVYPCFVQLYVGYRCHRVIQHRKSIRK